jgi:hypothetical protein
LLLEAYRYAARVGLCSTRRPQGETMRYLIAAISIALPAALAGCAPPPPPPPPPQPHMHAALDWLETARHELEIADQYRDHGGHAGAATHLTIDAMREVREGIAYRDSHAP